MAQRVSGIALATHLESSVMKDVQEMLEQLGRLQCTHITVHEERCVVVRNRHVSCRRCAQACTTGCISIEDGVLSIDTSKCIGCGTCATLCPTGALEICVPNDAELYKLCIQAIDQTTGTVRIACEQALIGRLSDEDATFHVAQVICLGRVDESLITMLACGGASRIELLKGDCSSCEYRHGEETAVQICNTANDLFKAWQIPATVYLVDKPSVCHAQEIDTNKIGTSCATNTLADDVAGPNNWNHELNLRKVGEDGTLPHAIPGRRRRLLAALDTAGSPFDQSISTRLWGRVEIDEQKCESCQMCAVFCPTAALIKFDDGQGIFGVDHYAARCVKCNSCIDICPDKAITLLDEVSIEDLEGSRYVRYVMNPRKRELGGPDQACHVMRNLLKCEQIYNR